MTTPTDPKARVVEIINKRMVKACYEPMGDEIADRLDSEGLLAPEACNWTQDEDGNWDTRCGEKFVFITDGPIENHMKFCCYCGGRFPAPKE